MTFRWWKVQGVCFYHDICDPELVEMSAEDHGRNCLERLEKIMVFFFPCFVMAAAIAQLMFGLFFSKKKVSCTRHLWIFYDPCGGRLAWPHVTSLYRSKKKIQLATTGKMRCR